MEASEIEELRRVKRIFEIAECGDDDAAVQAFLLVRRRLKLIGLALVDIVLEPSDWPTEVDGDAQQRLSKILSLTASDKEGESIAAFLMARRLSERVGLKLTALFDFGEQPGVSLVAAYPNLEIENIALRKKIRKLHQQLADKNAELKRYERAFNSMIESAWTAQHGPETGTTEPRLTH